MSERRPRALSTRPTRSPRPRAVVGLPRRPDASSVVRPTWRTIFRHSLLNGKLAALLLLLIGLGGVAYSFRSPRFLVSEVEVLGLRSLEPAEVAELAAVRGVSVWDVRGEAVAARVAANTYVTTATVQVLLPNRVVIRVREREAVIAWNAAGLNYEVTAEGAVLGPARTLEPSALVVYDTRPLSLTAGTYVDPDALDLAQTLNLRLPEELGFTPERYEWDPYYGLSIYKEGRQIAFGRMSDPAVPLDVKLATLKPLLLDKTDFVLLDLRSATPYYRPAPTPAPTPTQG